MQILPKLIADGKGVELVEFSWKKVRESPHIKLLQPELILGTLLSQFSESKMVGEGVTGPEISVETALSIIDFVSWSRKELSFPNQ
jgi:hypothetical protein